MQGGWEEAEEAEAEEEAGAGEEILQGAERRLIKALLQRSHLSAARFRYEEEGREKGKKKKAESNVVLLERRVFFSSFLFEKSNFLLRRS